MLARWNLVLAGLAVLATSSVVAKAQEKTTPGLDQQFVTDAAIGNTFELQMGRLAVDRSSDEDIKKFGERLLNDHSNSNKALMEIVLLKGFNVPNTLDEKHAKDITKFAKMQESDFDRNFINAMVEDHKGDISKFRMASREVKDADVRAFAQRTLPTLESHLKMAQDIAERLK